MFNRILAGALALAVPFAVRAPALAQEKVLKAVMHADVRVIDPVWTTQTIANIHGALVYDTLFGNDADQKPQPQMVDKYEISPDKLTYTFTLRDGLKFHDGSPVTTKDVIASLKRWGAKDGVGQRLMGFVTKMEPVDDKTFTMVLKEPYGMVLESLGKSGSSIAAIMREKDALTDPQQQIKESVGSGPYIFAKDQWVPGSKAVYLKNKDYKPRTEAPSSFAGAKIPGVDRIELVWISDPQTAMSALVNGEIDFYEAPPNDFLPLLEKARGVKLMKTGKIDSTQGFIRLNHLQPPFDNVKARQAMYYLINQEDFLRAIVGNPKYYKVCPALLTCGGPYESDGRPRVDEGVQSEEGAAAPQGGRLQGRADHRAVGDRSRHDHAGDPGADPGDARGRHQRRRAVDGLGLGRHAPRQEGPAGAGRLEHLRHDVGRRRLGQSRAAHLDRRGLRQGPVRLAVRPQDRGAAQRLRHGADRGGAEEDRQRAAGAGRWSRSCTFRSASGTRRSPIAPTRSTVSCRTRVSPCSGESRRSNAVSSLRSRRAHGGLA